VRELDINDCLAAFTVGERGRKNDQPVESIHLGGFVNQFEKKRGGNADVYGLRAEEGGEEVSL